MGRFITAGLVLLSLGCASWRTENPELVYCCEPPHEEVRMQYLGSGGWLIGVEGAALLTGPMFTNPGLFTLRGSTVESLLMVGIPEDEVRPDTDRIDEMLEDVDLSDVGAILIGHAHYDHLLDVPYIAQVHAPDAVVYGSETMKNLIVNAPGLGPSRVEVLNDVASDRDNDRGWVTDPTGRFRFKPLISTHAPQIFNTNLWPGRITEPLPAPPVKISEWLEGITLAYLIDVLDGEGDPIFRIYYQDAVGKPPMGYPPVGWDDDGVPVHVAILTAPGHDKVSQYPVEIILELEPDFVFGGHWEDFFRSPTDEPKPIPLSGIGEFVEKLEHIQGTPGTPPFEWRMPDPMVEFTFSPVRQGGSAPGEIAVHR